MKIGKHMHISFALGFAEYEATHNWDRLREFVKPKDKKLFLKGIAQLRKKGYEVVPPCKSVDERGMCKGHKK